MVEKIKDHPSVHTCKNVTLLFFYQKSERIKQTRWTPSTHHKQRLRKGQSRKPHATV